MTDIVERLRASQPDGTTGGYLLNDAADEINLLRQQIAGFPHLDDMRQAMVDTANENERLRQRVKELEAVLEKVNNEFGCQTADWPEPWRRIAELKEANGRCYRELAELRKAQGEPVGVVKHNGLGFPCVDLLGKNGAQYFGLEDGTKLYTSAPAGQRPADLSIPEGWQLVPVEPTPEMIAARVGFYDGGRTNAEYSCIAGYKAMLSAAPKPGEKE